MKRAVASVLITSFFLAAGVTAQTPEPPQPSSAPPSPASATPTVTPSKEFPKGTATPSAECGACHQAIYRRLRARQLWTGGHSGQRLGSALSLVMLQPKEGRAAVELHVINVGAGHSVPTGSNRRAIYLQTRVLDAKRKKVDDREWMFAPWYGPRPDDRAFLKEDEKRPDRMAATQADEQGPHEAPVRAGEERILRRFKGDQREISWFTLPLHVKASR